MPPPGAVFELAERAVEFVLRTIGLTLDYAPETLPALDHYLRQVPKDKPEVAALVAAAAGAYFGEVARRALDGGWEGTKDPEPMTWSLRLAGDVLVRPIGVATEAIAEDDTEGLGGFDVPDAVRPLIEEALDARGEVPEDEFYSLAGKLELLSYVVDLVVGARQQAAEAAAGPQPPAPDDESDG